MVIPLPHTLSPQVSHSHPSPVTIHIPQAAPFPFVLVRVAQASLLLSTLSFLAPQSLFP